jgi:hypothetical protein
MVTDTEKMIELLDMAGWGYDTDYSGRNMYGKTCLSVTYDEEMQLLHLFLDLAAMHTELEGGRDYTAGFVRSLARVTKVDNMGHGYVAYWPTLVTTGEDDEELDRT